MATLFDLEIAHLAQVMGASMIGDLAGPLLPGAHWRKRIYQLIDSQHLTNAQLRSLDSLLLQLDELEAQVSNNFAPRAAVSTG
jgi:hypothetical protein